MSITIKIKKTKRRNPIILPARQRKTDPFSSKRDKRKHNPKKKEWETNECSNRKIRINFIEIV